MSGWSVVAGLSVLVAAGILLLVVHRVVGELRRTAAAVQPAPGGISPIESSEVIARAEHLADGREGRPDAG